MATAENAKLQYEAGQNAVPMSALTDTGDATVFTSSALLWSQRSGYAPVVRVNGLVSGGELSVSATNNVVNVAALVCNLAGAPTSVNAGTATIVRAGTDLAMVNSITINASGQIAVVQGTQGTGQAFSEARGAAGGPAFIAPGSIEIAQVRVNTSAAAVVAASQILTVSGLHRERADDPLYDIEYNTGRVKFLAALSKIHTGGVARGVFASFAWPLFADVALASDFVPPENSYSVTSTQVYGTTIGSTSATLNQGTFTAYLNNGVTDPLVTLKGQNLWFRFYPDKYQSPYLLAQGKLGIARTFPAGNSIQAACTVSAASAGSEVA